MVQKLGESMPKSTEAVLAARGGPIFMKKNRLNINSNCLLKNIEKVETSCMVKGDIKW